VLTYNELINPTDSRVERILKAAEQHFKEFGYRKASIDKICKDAGLSKPTFYKYFNTKQTLFFAVRIYMLRDFFHRYSERTKYLESAAEKLKVYFQLVDEFTFSNKLFGEIFRTNSEMFKNWIKHPLGLETYLNRVDLLERVISEGIASNEFRAVVPRVLAHAAAMNGLLISALNQLPPDSLPKGMSIPEFVFDLVFNGIKKA